MKTRTILFALSTVLLVGETGSTGQQLGRRSNSFTLHPCPGGTGSAEVEVSSPTSLVGLVRMSQLIRVGTVAKICQHLIRIPSI